MMNAASIYLKTKNMKAIFTLFASLLALLAISFSAHAKVYIENGLSPTYDLRSNDTLIINSGLYKGKIQNNQSGWVIIIREQATFAPSTFSNVNGRVFNYGTVTLDQYLNTSNGFFLENYGDFSVKQGMAVGGEQKVFINNRANGTMYFKHSVSLSAPVTMVNDGSILFEDNLTLNGGSELINNNSIIVGEYLTINTGRIINNKRLSVNERFTINGGSSFINNSLLIAESGITNNGAITNAGLLWVSATGSNDFVNNGSGSIAMLPGSLIRTGSFTNNSSVSGEGTLYMLNNSVLNGSGSVGSNDPAFGEMVVYDASRTNAPKLFDTQWGSLYRNVVYRPVAEPDTATYAAAKFVVLPIKWKYFTATLQNNCPVLSWDAADNNGSLKFEVERSFDGSRFNAIEATSNVTYTDKNLQATQPVAYYRIKAISTSGEVKYSDIKMVKKNAAAASLSVWPNPTTATVKVTYSSTQKQSVVLVLKNIGGQKVSSKTLTAQTGSNQFEVTELAGQSSGLYFLELWSNNSLVAATKIVKR